MRRRDFIKGIAGPAMMWPLVGRAQQADGKAHVGVLGPSLDFEISRVGHQAFTAELQKLGFSQGKNLQLDYRRTDQGMDLVVAAARELVAAKTMSLSPSDRKYPCGQRWHRMPACRS